ncbi:MAG: universal stress protein [Syntrophotaleaceae bacterium]
MKILVPVDMSETSRATIEKLKQNSAFLPPGHLVLLHVVDLEKLAYRMIPDFQLEMIREQAVKTAGEFLEKRAGELREAGLTAESRLEIGSPREIIPRISNEEHFGLFVIGRRYAGEIRDVLFGSVANYALHRVKCPVLLF